MVKRDFNKVALRCKCGFFVQIWSICGLFEHFPLARNPQK